MNRPPSSTDRKKAKKKSSKNKDGNGSSSKSGSDHAKSNSGGEVESYATKRKSYRKTGKNNYLDDDDFSVAPSMDQDVKSVVSVSFDDVYARGRKVGYTYHMYNGNSSCVIWGALNSVLTLSLSLFLPLVLRCALYGFVFSLLNVIILYFSSVWGPLP
jgi:hypothetical protein